jgi:hypothetical protein
MSQEQEGPLLQFPPPVEEWFNKWKAIRGNLPPTLFHYTDANGLCGIVRSGALWATHIDYLNDAQEFKYAHHLITNVFERLEEQEPGKAARLHDIKKCLQGHYALWEAALAPYVACFCKSDNVLSQWRAYASNCGGFAVGFDPEKLIALYATRPETAGCVDWFKIIYQEAEQTSLIEQAIRALLDAFETSKPEKVIDSVPFTFSRMYLSFKHPVFYQEEEWRLVYMAQSPHFVDIRVSGGQLLPFAALKFQNPNERPPYTNIVYGPTLEAENTKRALEMLIGKENQYWDQVIISGFDAPLRVPGMRP